MLKSHPVSVSGHGTAEKKGTLCLWARLLLRQANKKKETDRDRDRDKDREREREREIKT